MSRALSRPLPCRLSGATLGELAVTLSVAAVLLSVAVPNLSAFVADNRITSGVNALIADLNYARSAAIRSAVPVSVCKSADGAACTTAGDWDQGWLIFEDPDRDRQIDPAETILRVHGRLNPGLSLRFAAFGSSNHLSYDPTGLTRDRNGTFTFCDTTGSRPPKAVILYKTGRARVSWKRSDGGPLGCS
jgi:type IV fimbrial biogenesis protein FimT